MTRPNILIIYPDQMRFDALACAGNPVIKTPHLDRLAAEGVMFTESYVSYPVCSPFRASVLTGKYAQGHGMVQNHFPLRAGQTFLAECLRDAGYRTGYIGKWHLEGGAKPGFVPVHRRFGFEHFLGFNRGHDYLASIYFDDAGRAHHSPRYEPDYQTDQFIDFIDAAVTAGKADGKPFFGYVSYGPPHFPMNMPDYLRRIYRPEEVPLPPGVPNPDLQRAYQKLRSEIYCGGDARAMHTSHAAHNPAPGEAETEDEIRQFIAAYYAMIHNIDWNVGRILNRLDALGVAQHTAVVFCSDHGDMLGQHGNYCGIKNEAWRAAMQVPLIIRLPNRFAPHRSAAMVDVGVDMMPTLLDLCGVELPADMHGISYLPVLDGDATDARDAVMYQSFMQNGGNPGEYAPYAQRGIRTKDYLYVRHKNRRVMLFDERADAHEQHNLVDDAKHAKLMDEFDARIASHMQATGDDWDMAANFPPPDFVTHAQAKKFLQEELLPNAIRVD